MSDSQRESKRHAISCINCRTRKVKCDKVHPCGPCQKLQVDCTFRAKKARPKKAIVSKSKSGDINSRLDRLDQLVSKLGSLQHQLPSDVQSLLTNSTREDLAKPESGPGTGKPAKEPSFGKGIPQMRSEFWMNLSDEVEGLRNTLCGDDSDDYESSSEDEALSNLGVGPANRMAPFIFGGGSIVTMQSRKHPSAAEVLRLTEIFYDRVDSLFKYLHVPTVRSLVARVIAEGERPALSKPEHALMFSIYYAAVNSVQDHEYALMQQDRRSALMYYKSCTEAALSEADLLCTTDIVTLQAFITYLLALRSIDSSQATWSLIGLAIRLAQALDLHRDTTCSRIPPYDLQMRRRLYWQLCLMDIQSFQDRGLSPLMQSSTPIFPSLPANVDDADFGTETKESIVSRLGMTEMTIPLLSYITTQTALRLASRPSNAGQSDISHVHEALRGLHDTIGESMKYFDMSKAICWFSKFMARIAILKIFLLAHIPVHIRLHKAQPNITKQDVLILCITIMELHATAQDDEPLSRYAWYNTNWHQWHPLAVALAELIYMPTGPLADRAWQAVSSNFDKWRESVADGRKGPLWRPIKRLYDKARKARMQALGINVATPSSNSDISSPAAELAIPKLQDSGDRWHRLHDAALRKALALGPTDPSPIVFLSSDVTASSADSMAGDYMTPAGSSAAHVEAPINWDDWDTFLRESYESGIGAPDTFDESLMQGIMDMPFEMAPAGTQLFPGGVVPMNSGSPANPDLSQYGLYPA